MDADLYVPGDGWLHRTDPRVKFLISIVMLALCLVWRNWAFILGVLILEHVMLATDRVPAERIGWVWKILAVLIVFIVVLWPVFDQSGTHVLWQWGWAASHAGEPAHGGGDGSAHSSARLCMLHHAVHHQPDQAGSWPYLARCALQGRAYLGNRITVYSRVLLHLPIRVRSAACARA